MCRYFAFVEECQEGKACTILLRGASKDILQELDRNCQDILGDCRALFLEPRLLPGGGATECALSAWLETHAPEGVERAPFLAISAALQIIPRTLAQNCGADALRVLTDLSARHHSPTDDAAMFWGIDGISGRLLNMSTGSFAEGSKSEGLVIPWEPFSVKMHYIRSSIEAACMLLRVDDIVAGKAASAPSGKSAECQDQDCHDDTHAH